MAHRDLIVIGASSGGVEAVSKLLEGLPPTLPAAVFVVVHVRPDTPSYLPAILNRAGRLPAAHAVDAEPIRLGRVYVAPPGMQTYLQLGRIAVRRGPQENLHRPAVDALFRTAAHHYGPRVVGVVLTGSMDDGSAGLEAVKKGGGVAIVQDPKDAAFPSMPSNAIERADPDYCVPLVDLAPLLIGLAGNHVDPAPPLEVPLETLEEAADGDPFLTSEERGIPSALSCPDCSGMLWEVNEGGTLRFRCRVGHAYSAESMEKAQFDSVERALWTALRALEERVALMRKLTADATRRRHHAVATMFEQRTRLIEEDARAVHRLITTGQVLEPVGHDGI
jgi:two-component system chemotaxis response regulator CheB